MSHLWINGQNCNATDGALYDIHSPANGRVIGQAAAASVADIEKAIASAEAAFVIWSNKTAYERETIMRGATAQVRTQAEEIGRLMALEQGKPWSQATGEVHGACDMIDYYASEAPRIEGTLPPTEKSSFRSWVTHHPVGVCAGITPWNYPVALLSWKLGPALAAGCAMVVKPTPVTPLSPLAFCQALTEGGVPVGLINVLTGPDAALGEALVGHPGIAKVAMTGSTRVGKQIFTSCAPSLKRISLELGGHCPAIVCADADLDLAAKVLSYKGFRNCGQSCSSVNRVFAHESIHDALVERLSNEAQNMTMGDGITDPKVDLGPLTTAATRALVENHVSDAIEHGAKLIFGGSCPSDEAYQSGHYYLPTVLTQADARMKLWKEETFGPVLPVTSFDDTEIAVAQANDSTYGLVSYVFTRDLETGLHLSEQLESGTVCLNHGAVNSAYAPYEGWKESGFGLELSRRAIFEYLKTKHVKVAL